MAKCVSCGKGAVVIDHVNKTTIHFCDKCDYIYSVAFPDGSVFDGEFKNKFYNPKTGSANKFEKCTGIFTDMSVEAFEKDTAIKRGINVCPKCWKKEFKLSGKLTKKTLDEFECNKCNHNFKPRKTERTTEYYYGKKTEWKDGKVQDKKICYDKKEIKEASKHFKKVNNVLEELRESNPRYAKCIEGAKLPAIISESVAYWMIVDKKCKFLKDLPYSKSTIASTKYLKKIRYSEKAEKYEVVKGNKDKATDILIDLRNGTEQRIEVKATQNRSGQSFTAFAKKDIEADYIIWMEFNDTFREEKSKKTIKCSILKDPKNNGLGNLRKPGTPEFHKDGKCSWANYEKLATKSAYDVREYTNLKKLLDTKEFGRSIVIK